MTKTISICLFFLISASNFPALGEEIQGQDVQTLLLKAKKLVTEEKYTEAISQFETILKQFPDAPQIKDAIFLLAGSYVKLVQPEKAEEIYLFALKKYQDDTTYSMRIHNALAELYISTQQLQKAIKSYHAILETEPDYTTSLQVFEKIEKLHLSQEDYAEAAEIRKELLSIYPKLLEKHITDPSINAFWRVRAQIDRSNFTAENYSLIARLQEQAGKKQEAFSTHRFLTTSFSQSPFAIKSFYSMAEHLSAQGDYTNAVAFYLNSIIRSTTPLLSFRAIGIENREFIDTHNRERLTGAEVKETLGKIYTLLNKTTKISRLQEATSTLLQPWEQAHKFVELNRFDKAIAIYQEISQKTDSSLSSLARYFISLCLYYQGNGRDTIAELTPLLEDKDLKEITPKDTPEQIFEKTLDVYALTLAGYSYFNLGNYGKAERFLKRASEKSLTAAYKLAQAYEFQGKLKKAEVAYQKVAQTENKELSDLSLFSINRINSSEKSLTSLSVKKAPKVIYVGEDRITKGNWRHNYGKELTVLCGFNAPADWVEGDSQEKFKYNVYTGNPKKFAKTWLSKSFETAEYFLQYPGETDKRRPCNWDDQGEIYPLGKGPDLFVSLSIPSGRYRLALYFLNDPNYYEPNRQYTVYIQDKNGEILSATSVGDFYSGVYKKFLITGPTEITIRIFRNLSLNTLLSGVFIDSYKPDDFPVELLKDCERSQDIKSKILGTYNKNKEIATKPDFSYADFENSQELWHTLSKTVSDIYQKELVVWNRICMGFSLAHLLHQNWQYKERDTIMQKILKDWQKYPKTVTDKEGVINSQIALMFQIYQTEWIKGNFKMEFTRQLVDSITKFLTGEKASYVSHKFIKTIPTGKSVAYQPWIYEFIIYEKLVESKLAGPFDMRKLGILYINYGDPAKALPVFQQIVDLADNTQTKQEAYLGIMIAYEKLSKEEVIKKTLKELQTLDPLSSTSQEGEIKLYTYLNEKGKKEEAYEILKSFASKYPDSEYLPFVKKQLQNIESK